MATSDTPFEEGKDTWEPRVLRITYHNGRWFETRGYLVPLYLIAPFLEDEGWMLGIVRVTDAETGEFDPRDQCRETGDVIVVWAVARVTDAETGELVFDPRDELSLEKMPERCKQFMISHPEWPSESEPVRAPGSLVN